MMADESLFPEDVQERQRRMLAAAYATKDVLKDAQQRHEDAVWNAGWVHGYDQGWNDGYQRAIHALREAAFLRSAPPNVGATEPTPLPREAAPEADAPSANEIILNLIAKFPGLRGFELVEATESAGTPVKERTVRTALYRLKNSGKIFSNDERWYPAGYILFPDEGGGMP